MLTAPTPQLVVVNESTRLDQAHVWNMAWALGYQIKWQFGPIWRMAADIAVLAAKAPIPAGSSPIVLMDKCDVEGALGYHDEDGNEVPFGRVGVETALENGQQPSEVLSHEGLELLVDQHVNLTSFDPSNGRLYPVEVGDPVQGFSYDLAAPYGRQIGILMSDFAKPNWFDPNTDASVVTNYHGTWDTHSALHGPFALGPAGYVSYATALPPDWKQEMGEHANKAIVDNDDRVQRRLAAS